MLRVEMQDSADATVFRLEGRLTREGAEHLRALVTQSNNSGTELILDLTDVMFVDSVGEELLTLVKTHGAQFVAETSYSLDVCERLHLPLAGPGRSDALVSGNSNRQRYSTAIDCRRPMEERTKP